MPTKNMDKKPNSNPEELDEEMKARAASPVIPENVEHHQPQEQGQEIKQPEPPKFQLPICRVCQGELEALQTLDYGHLRVVIHTRNRCVVGVLYTDAKIPNHDPQEEES